MKNITMQSSWRRKTGN